LVNGAPLADPTPKGTIPHKTAPKYWNRLFHQKKDGTFEDVTEKAGLQGVSYGMGVAAGDYDNDGYEDLYVTAYGGNRLCAQSGDVFRQAWVGRGMAVEDIDNDGRVDAVVTTNDGPAYLLHNETATVAVLK
jgi:peptidoglycan hydrolase-like protein with peptidoglycan-binding domain